MTLFCNKPIIHDDPTSQITDTNERNDRMNWNRYFVLLVCFFAFSTFAGCSKPAKNIIFMCPDGMGLANVSTARTYLYGPNGDRLNFEKLPYIGYQRTASKTSFVTDSAAAASAWASGEKFKDGEISCHDENGDGQCDGTRKNQKTILELAVEKQMATGLVVTADITHATPAAWGAHTHSRKCESEIFKQMLENDINVLLGGGIATNRKQCKLEHTAESMTQHLISKAEDRGYQYVTTRDELSQVAADKKLLGLFKTGGLTPIYKRGPESDEPTLEEMTRKALSILEANPNGFFLLVEGSQVDWANHARHLEYQIHEMIDFDNAAKAVMDWIYQKRGRTENTLLMVSADHECGGVIIDGPYGDLPAKGRPEAMDVVFSSNFMNPLDSADHTAVDTIIWANQPQCGKALENTDLFYIMRDFIGGN